MKPNAVTQNKSSGEFRLNAVSLGSSLSINANPELRRERDIAIFDLLEQNAFMPAGHDGGPYRLKIDLADARLVLAITLDNGAPVVTHHLSLTPLRLMIKYYGQICESYFEAAARANPERLEAIDMARRAMHNDAAEMLRKRLGGKITVDEQTSRRLFTLIFLLVTQNTLLPGAFA